MTTSTHDMMIAAKILELCNEAAFLAAGIGCDAGASQATSAAVYAGAILGLTELQVRRMQAEQSSERARTNAESAKRLQHVLRSVTAKPESPKRTLRLAAAGHRSISRRRVPANDAAPSESGSGERS